MSNCLCGEIVSGGLARCDSEYAVLCATGGERALAFVLQAYRLYVMFVPTLLRLQTIETKWRP